MSSLPVIAQPQHRSAALLDQLARRMRVRAESALEPLGIRPRHLVALTVLRDLEEVTQQSLAATLQLDGHQRLAKAEFALAAVARDC